MGIDWRANVKARRWILKLTVLANAIFLSGILRLIGFGNYSVTTQIMNTPITWGFVLAIFNAILVIWAFRDLIG